MGTCPPKHKDLRMGKKKIREHFSNTQVRDGTEGVLSVFLVETALYCHKIEEFFPVVVRFQTSDSNFPFSDLFLIFDCFL